LDVLIGGTVRATGGFELGGRKVADGGVSARRVGGAFDEPEDGGLGFGLRREWMTVGRLVFEGGEEASHMALSGASPAVPVDGRTPAARQRCPNAHDAYYGPLSL
jgi:hypothetical protein